MVNIILNPKNLVKKNVRFLIPVGRAVKDCPTKYKKKRPTRVRTLRTVHDGQTGISLYPLHGSPKADKIGLNDGV